MDKKKLLILVPLAIGFAAAAAVQVLAFQGRSDIWHILEVLAVISAAFFNIPGAVAGTAVAVAVGLAANIPSDSDMLMNYVRLAVVTGLIGWFASRRQLQQEHLGRLLMVDRLTGLHNYSYFIDRLGEERMRADRFGSRLALIMIDIDHFKSFNEKHGHQKGNELIKHLAEIVKIQVRGVDIVSRYGGEEFAILLPNTGRAAAEEIAERIRAAVETSDFAAAGAAEVRTISGGIATYPADAEDDLQLIDNADEALSRAKEAGRNRIITFGADRTKQEAIS